MSLLFFSEDLMLKIWKMVTDDKLRCSLVLTCKEFRNIGFKFGWLRAIHFTKNHDLLDFITFYSRPNHFLERIKISGIIEPHVTVLDYTQPWPKEIEFERCYIGSVNSINIPVSPTERLVIRDLHRHRTGGTAVVINWSSLPNLKVLDIYAPDIDFEGLDMCKKLEVVRIDLDRVRFLPSFFSNFADLRVLATTCISSEPMHFVSKKLKICMVPKKHLFSSESLLVPKSHLGLDTPINIQCIDI